MPTGRCGAENGRRHDGRCHVEGQAQEEEHPAGPPGPCPDLSPYALGPRTMAWRAMSSQMERELGVTGPQRLAIRLISLSPGKGPAELAEMLHVHRSAATGIIRRLEAKGLVTRKVHFQDARRRVLSLTAAGRRIDGVDRGGVEFPRPPGPRGRQVRRDGGHRSPPRAPGLGAQGARLTPTLAWSHCDLKGKRHRHSAVGSLSSSGDWRACPRRLPSERPPPVRARCEGRLGDAGPRQPGQGPPPRAGPPGSGLGTLAPSTPLGSATRPAMKAKAVRNV